jgi:hypothetical protein
MKKYVTSILIILMITSILTACTGEGTPTEDPQALMTSVVGTMVGSFFGTQTAMVPPPSPIPSATIQPLPSSTVIYPTATFVTGTPTFLYYTATPGTRTVTPTGTLSTATVAASALAVGCNNLAFIRDVNYPAGSVVENGQDFRKTWKVQNNGTCPWMYQYTLVSAGGDSLGGATTKIQRSVTVWDWSELSLDLAAPKKPGKYTSYWRLSNGLTPFGATLTVTIVVPDPTAVPATAVPATAIPDTAVPDTAVPDTAVPDPAVP